MDRLRRVFVVSGDRTPMRSTPNAAGPRPVAMLLAVLLLAGAALPAADGRAAPAASPDAPPDPPFDLHEIRVLGNTRLDAATIERSVYPHLGPGRRLADVQAAATALEEAYRAAGYGTVFVDIPEQSVDEGIVRLQVTEGRLDRVAISGAVLHSGRQLRRELPSARTGEVPNLTALQEEISEANRVSPDRAVVPVLKAGREPGTVDLELKVDEDLPVHGSLAVDDRYTADTSRLRVAASIGYSNLFQRFDEFSLQYQTAPEEPSESRVIAASYTRRLAERRRLSLYAVDSDSDVATVGTLSVLGVGRVYGARLLLPMAEGPGSSHSVLLGGDYKDFVEDVRLTVDEGLRTPISYALWSAAYLGSWRAEAYTAGATFGANIGLRGVGNGTQEFADKRYGAKPGFLYLRGSGNYVRELADGWQAAALVAGQYAADPLIGNEQFPVGGAESVRGYLEAETLGDVGAAVTVEVRTPRRLFAGERFGILGLAFVDYGFAQVLEALPDQDDFFQLAGVGAGLRLAGGGVVGALDWAYPLRDGTRTPKGDSRVHFSFAYEF